MSVSEDSSEKDVPLRLEIQELLGKISSLQDEVRAISTHCHYEGIDRNNFYREFRHSMIEAQDRERDIISLLLPLAKIERLNLELVAERNLAFDTVDHVRPRGAAADNTRHPRFVFKCEEIIKGPIRHLDIGCAGGGLVWDFTVRGHLSVGIEGSDYPRRLQRAEWRTIPDRLFTADVRFPFHFLGRNGFHQTFNLVTAWELFEHIPKADIGALLANLHVLLEPDGLLVASVATFSDKDEAGHEFHATIESSDWWRSIFEAADFSVITSPFAIADYPRGSGNPRSSDWNAGINPELGFHIVARRR